MIATQWIRTAPSPHPFAYAKAHRVLGARPWTTVHVRTQLPARESLAPSRTLDATFASTGSSGSVRRRWETYRLALEGHGIHAIARITKRSPQAVHSMLGTLEHMQVVRRVPGCSPALYERGSRAMDLEMQGAIGDWHIEPENGLAVKDSTIRVEPRVRVRFHALVVGFRIMAFNPALLMSEGWRSWPAASGTMYGKKAVYISGVPYDVEVRGRRLLIYLADTYVDTYEDYRHAREAILEAAKDVALQIAARYRIAIDPRGFFNQRQEIAFEDSGGVLMLARKALLSIGDVWQDTSHGFPELETHAYDLGLVVFALVEGLRTGRVVFADRGGLPFLLGEDGSVRRILTVKELAYRDRPNP